MVAMMALETFKLLKLQLKIVKMCCYIKNGYAKEKFIVVSQIFKFVPKKAP